MKMYQQILLAAVPTVLALAFLSPRAAILVFIMLGQGHFLITYLYQYRAGKMNAAYGWRYLATLVFIGLFLYVTDGSLKLLILATATIFEIHFVVDELYLLKTKVDWLLTFAVAPFFFLYPISVLDKLFATDLLSTAVFFALGCSFIYMIGTLWRRYLSYGGLWMVFLAVIFIAITQLFDVSVEKLLASVVLYHYFRWILFYGDKYWHTPRFAPYLRDVLLIHGVTILLFVWYWYVPGFSRSVLSLLFSQMAFYLGTWLHIASSARIGGLGKFLPSFSRT